MIHFAPSELARRAWSAEPEKSAKAELSMPIYTHQRADFSLSWLPFILAKAIPLSMQIAKRNNEPGPSVSVMSGFGDALRKWRTTVPNIPIVTAEEVSRLASDVEP